ncbi:hypothetical protein J6590_085951 [Homalodisca vitripennis]|nr:hypothetical protein J6590_085951 [Homalodisca vitripennis]
MKRPTTLERVVYRQSRSENDVLRYKYPGKYLVLSSSWSSPRHEVAEVVLFTLYQGVRVLNPLASLVDFKITV